jgi:pantetheine-phosphate adenylyltransferase
LLTAVYPGSFDPITLGHLDIILRACKICDKLIIAIGKNSYKKNTSLLSLKTRLHLINKVLKDLHVDIQTKIEVKEFDGLLVDFVKLNGSKLIIRGLRAFSDFDYEFNLAMINSKISKDVETMFLMANENKQFISSKFVKELLELNIDLSPFLPKIIIEDFLKLKGEN